MMFFLLQLRICTLRALDYPLDVHEPQRPSKKNDIITRWIIRVLHMLKNNQSRFLERSAETRLTAWTTVLVG
jgi:hypothetical protein